VFSDCPGILVYSRNFLKMCEFLAIFTKMWSIHIRVLVHILPGKAIPKMGGTLNPTHSLKMNNCELKHCNHVCRIMQRRACEFGNIILCGKICYVTGIPICRSDDAALSKTHLLHLQISLHSRFAAVVIVFQALF